MLEFAPQGSWNNTEQCRMFHATSYNHCIVIAWIIFIKQIHQHIFVFRDQLRTLLFFYNDKKKVWRLKMKNPESGSLENVIDSELGSGIYSVLHTISWKWFDFSQTSSDRKIKSKRSKRKNIIQRKRSWKSHLMPSWCLLHTVCQ